MDIADYLRVIRRRKWVILSTLTLTVLVVMVGAQFLPPTYQAVVSLRVMTATVGTSDYAQRDIRFTVLMVNTYAAIAQSPVIQDELKARLGSDTLPDIQLQPIEDSEVLLVSVEDSDPVLAQTAANALADILIDHSDEVFVGWDSEVNPVSLIAPATLPQKPIRPNKMLFGAFSLVAGAIGGTGLAFLLENLDSRLYTADQIRKLTDLPILGRIPEAGQQVNTAQLFATYPYTTAFEWLYISLLPRLQTSNTRILAITSPEPQEGKSTIAVNLARTMAQGGQRVLIVDADLRRPVIHQKLGLTNTCGLSTVLLGQIPLGDAVQPIASTTLSVLTSGPPTIMATQFIVSQQFKAILQQLALQYDLVIVDTPAFAAVSDTAVLAMQADGVILVSRLGHARRAGILDTIQQLATNQVRPLGVIINSVDRGARARYYKHYYIDTPALPPTEQDTVRVSTSVLTLQPRPTAGDQLTQVRGIGPVLEKRLHKLGIFTYAQLAEADPDILAERLGGRVTAKRITECGWIEQARARLKTDGQSHDEPVKESVAVHAGNARHDGNGKK